MSPAGPCDLLGWSMVHASFLYFAYGEQLAERAMALLCPGAEAMGLARLERHGWVWAPHGRLSVRAGEAETVWGRLWMTPAPRLEALDAYHNVAGGDYLREARMIWCTSGPRIPATLYVQPEGQGEGERVDVTHLDHVLGGAREAGFDGTVVAALARSAERQQVSR